MDELAHIAELRAVTMQRLQVLQLQAAAGGVLDTPAHVLVAIREAKAEIAQYDALLRSPLPPAAADQLSPAAHYAVLSAKLDDLTALILQQLDHLVQVEIHRRRYEQQLYICILLLLLLVSIAMIW